MEAKPAAALEAATAAVPAARSPRRSPRNAKERRPSLTLQGLQFSTLVTGKTSGRIYGSHSLCFFSVSHPVRRFAIDAIEWVWFDRIVLLLIVINCVFLAMDSKAPGFEETTRGCASPPAPRANSAPSQRSHFNAKIDSTFT